jgi:hypothetical protein
MNGFDYSTIIGRDPKLFRFHVDNVIRNAGLSREHWDFNVVVYYNESIPREVTDEILDICAKNSIEPHMQYEDPRLPFIIRLYDAWNLVQRIGKRPLTLRAGSDQTWYPGSFKAIYEAWQKFSILSGPDVILQSQTIESPLAGQSRHFVKPFGNTPAEYDEKAFVSFCETIKSEGLYDIDQCVARWGHPTPFSSSIRENHNRTDGCSWLQTKDLFQRFGPMPYVRGNWTGDVWIHDNYERSGIPNYLVGDCITYHMVRGESRGQ